MIFLILLLVCLSVFLLRALPRLIFKKVNNFDTYFHLFFIDFIKKNGVRSMVEPKRFIRPFGLDYPWLMHWFISLFPKSTQSLMERFLNPLLDSLFTIALFFVFLVLDFSQYQALIGCLMYVFSPLTFSNVGTGPRITTFTPRLAGEVLVGGVFILEFLFFLEGSWLYFIAAVAIASTAYMVSKFSVQALMLVNLLLSLILLKWEPLLICILSLLTCLIYTRAYYLKILKQQVTHLSYFFQEVLAGRWFLSERNNWNFLWGLIRNRNFRKVGETLLVKNSYFILLYKAPIVLIALFLMLGNELTLADKFLLAGVLVFLITSLKWFLFIGEAERYINFVIVFAIIGVLQSSTSLFVVYSLIVYGMLYYLADLLYFSRREMSQNSDKNDWFIEYLNGLESNKRIATIPYHLGGWRIAYHTEHDWYYPIVFLGNDLERSKDFWLKYPFLNFNKCKELIEEYDLDMVFLDVEAIEKGVDLDWNESGLIKNELCNGVVELSVADKTINKDKSKNAGLLDGGENVGSV